MNMDHNVVFLLLQMHAIVLKNLFQQNWKQQQNLIISFQFILRMWYKLYMLSLLTWVTEKAMTATFIYLVG